MRKQQTKKQIILDLIEKCTKRIDEVNDLKKLSRDGVFKKDISILDRLVGQISIIEPKIEQIQFSDVRKKRLGSDRFTGFLVVSFCLLAVFSGFLGKYLSRPGFYNFQEQSKYINILFYGLLALTTLIGVVLYVKYYRTVKKKNVPLPLSTYCYNLMKLKGAINKMNETKIGKLLDIK